MGLKIEYVKVSELKPYEKNTRKHKDLDVDNIAKSIEKYGFNDPIGIWHDEIVEGHGRLLAAKELMIEEVPIIRLDHLTDEGRREYAIAHNATAELSEWDMDFLGEELNELELSDFDFDFDFGIEEENEADDYEARKKEFEERMASGELSEDDEEYQEFLAKEERTRKSRTRKSRTRKSRTRKSRSMATV